MVLALRNKSDQCSFSAMFFGRDKSNKLFFANIEARKAYYFVVGDRSKPIFGSISQSFIQSSFDPYLALFRTYLGLTPKNSAWRYFLCKILFKNLD
ncbi:MAG: hypothetical protein WBM44_20320 [Waterburya sp.]